jgi:hypothetical protein
MAESTKKKASAGDYRVVCAFLTYRQGSDENVGPFAVRNDIITLQAAEAQRLVDLDAVVAKGDPDPEAMVAARDLEALQSVGSAVTDDSK